jgi:hypothetical protein
MAKRTTPSLAASEYVSPNSNTSVQVWRARLQVIEAARRVFPIFLEKLSACTRRGGATKCPEASRKILCGLFSTDPR